jgi:hypothetical protein
MPQVELKTWLRPLGRRRKGESELVLEFRLTPRGSGNRKLARALASAAKNHPKLGPHVKRVQAGSSKVWVVLRPSLTLMQVVAAWKDEMIETADVPGQLPLFTAPG